MKCIIRQYGFGGGAPRSILQHIKVLKALSYFNIDCMASNTDNQLRSDFEREVDQVIVRTSPAQLCFSRQYICAFKEYLWEYKYIKNQKPELVISLGQLNGALYSNICKKLGIPLIIYIAGGEIKQHDPCIGLWHDCETICFSMENADMIIKHFSELHTNVISNRIAIKTRFDDIDVHYMKPNPEINILVVSRLDQDKMNSIYSTLKVLEKCASSELIINVRIAGKGNCQNELNTFCSTLHNNNMNIQMLGQIHDLTEQFRWAHIVAGKGRSVIEPIMMNRIGCIIGEDGKIEFCSKDNFDNLYHYNFSGRQLRKENSYAEMNEMLQRIKTGTISRQFVIENADLTIQQYAAEFLPKKLEQVLNKIPESIKPDTKISLLFGYIRLVTRLMLYELLYHKE